MFHLLRLKKSIFAMLLVYHMSAVISIPLYICYSVIVLPCYCSDVHQSSGNHTPNWCPLSICVHKLLLFTPLTAKSVPISDEGWTVALLSDSCYGHQTMRRFSSMLPLHPDVHKAGAGQIISDQLLYYAHMCQRKFVFIHPDMGKIHYIAHQWFTNKDKTFPCL